MEIIKKKLVPLSVGKYLNTIYKFNQQKAADKAFSIFCTPRRGKILPHQEKFLNSARQEEVIFQNEKMQLYIWEGTGKTVLLVHGWESNSHRWKSLVQDLRALDYNVISIDAPAHGASSGKKVNVLFYAECLQEIIRKYQPEFVVGHSIGAMSLIFNHYNFNNSTTKKMVALGAPSEFKKIMGHYQQLLRLQDPFMVGLEDFFQKKFGFSFEEFSAVKFVRHFEISGLIIHNKIDPVVPLDSSVKLHENWKHSEFIITEGLGHSLQSKQVNNAIIQFFKT